MPAIDEDIARMEERLANAKPSSGRVGLSAPKRLEWKCAHRLPGRFTQGHAIEVALAVQGDRPETVVLRYRRVNQVERFVAIEMTPTASGFRAQIPAAYTRSPFPVQYYFELARTSMFPGLGANLAGQPYFVLRQA